jgi:Zn-finger nucleic acid-binding protein
VNCPRCNGSVLEPMSKKGLDFHGCRACRGLLLEKAAREKLVVLVRSEREKKNPGLKAGDYFNGLVNASEFSPSNKAMPCPRCKYNMYEIDNRDLTLDFCLNCQAIWFDAGELQQVVQRLKQGEVVSLVPLPTTDDHATGLILQVLRDEWL